MKRVFCILFAFLFLFSSCEVSFSEEKRSADEILTELLAEFSIGDGYLYCDAENAVHPLTDEMLERVFFGAELADLRYVDSMAMYFSRRYSKQEIIVAELFDISHREAVMALFQKRAEKKENAVVFTNGVYIFLICTDQNEAIKSFLL